MNVGEGKRNYQTSGIFSFPFGRLRPHLLLLLRFSAPTHISHWSCFASHAILDICVIVQVVLSKRKCLLNKSSKPGSNCESKSDPVEAESHSQNARVSQCWFFWINDVKHKSWQQGFIIKKENIHKCAQMYTHFFANILET